MGPRTVRKMFADEGEDAADREWACLRLLDEQAPGLAPRPLERSQENGSPVIVMERIPGRPLELAPASAEQNRALGRTLRRLHDVPLVEVARAGLGERRLGPNALVSWLRDKFSQDLDVSDCEEPTPVQASLEHARQFVLDRPNPAPQPLTALGIADLNPANVLWDGTTCRLVDFEDGGLTRPEFELADHLEHIAARSHRVYDAVELVRAADLANADKKRLTENRALWAVFWLHALLPGNGAYDRNPRGTTECQARHVLKLLTSGDMA